MSELDYPESKPWKTLWLTAASRLDEIGLRIEPSQGRVAMLAKGYAKIVAELLRADVNGGLDEEYADFPDPPPTGN
jgi:hypothetical protein